jgi:predicted outer membrane protein
LEENMRIHHKRLGSVMVVTILGFAACRDAGYTDRDTAAVVTDTTAVGGNVEAYSDANAVAFIQTVNTGEIETAALAKTKATDPEFKAFARQLETDHTALKNEVAETAQRLGLSATATDEDVLEKHQAAMKDLNEAKAGKEFDGEFINESVAAHKKALDKIDDAIDKTQNAEFKALLQKARGAIDAHLQRAEELDKKV